MPWTVFQKNSPPILNTSFRLCDQIGEIPENVFQPSRELKLTKLSNILGNY